MTGGPPGRVAADGQGRVAGDPVDRLLWDATSIDEGQWLVQRCLSPRPAQPGLGPYQIQAAIGAVHSDSAATGAPNGRRSCGYATNWLRSHRRPWCPWAVALAEVCGPASALAEVDRLDLDAYHRFHAAHADLLVRVGRPDDADGAYARSIALSGNAIESRFLGGRPAAIAGTSVEWRMV